MKSTTFFTIAIFFIMNTVFGQSYNSYNTQNNAPGGNVTMKPVKDQNGMVTAYIPLPSNWQIAGPKIKSPDGYEFFDYPGQKLTGRQITSIDQVIQTDVMNLIRQNNCQYVGVEDLPQVAENDRRMYANYWSAMPVQNHHEAKGIEVKDDKGNRGYAVVHYTLSQSQYGSFAFYYLTLLGTETGGNFERAKRTLIYALANMKQDPQAVAMHNQREQQKSRNSWAAHNQKMRSNQQNFDNWQKTQQDLSSINDIYYEGYKERSAMRDAGQEKVINSIREEEPRTNPYGGGQTNVSQNYKYYYMNQYGQYFGTNDPNYNPATDPNMNHMEWRKMQQPQNRY